MTPISVHMTIEQAMAILFKLSIENVEHLTLEELTAISYGVDALKTIQDMSMKG